MGVTNYFSVDGEVIAESGASGYLSYHRDNLGSVCATLDSSGALVHQYQYKPFGELWSASGAGAQERRLQWCGSWGYSAIALTRKFLSYYVRARHYAALLGNWTSVDPLWPSEMAYGYVEGRVMTGTDPSGMLLQNDKIVICLDKASKVDPCGCPGKNNMDPLSRVGYVFIDCNCVNQGVAILSEKGKPITVPKCGTWIAADAVQFSNGFPHGSAFYKIHGQTCALVDCGLYGVPSITKTCCSRIAIARNNCSPSAEKPFGVPLVGPYIVREEKS